MATLAIDLETYSSNDIRQGSRKYVDTPDFELLLMGYSFDDEPVTVVDLTAQPFPERVRAALYDPDVLKTAFNANFEMTCFKRVFPDLPLAGWECTSVLSLYNSLPARLEDVARILHLGEDKQKDARGKALIRFFSIPCRPTKANGGRTRNYPADDPAKWAEYIEYNRQDVVVEKAIRRRLLGLRPPQEEKRLWYMDQRINNDGIAIDRQMVANAIRLNTEYRDKIMDEARALTGLDNPNSVIQLKDWLATRINEPLESLDKKAVKGLLDRPGIPRDVQRLLRIRQLLGKTSIKKYEAMAGSVCGDGRIHNMFMFYGASRSGRFSGRNVQLQNLARNSMPDLDTAREVVKGGDLGTLEMLYDNVPDVLSQLIRTALIAPEGSRFIVADFSAIEARVIAWLAGEQWRMDAFRAGRDIYCESASQMFGVPVVKHGINGELRAKGKVAELACIAEGQLVLTDHGLVPIECVTTGMRVWDSEQFVHHGGVVCRGEKDVITYDGLTATTNHLVWVEGQTKPVHFGLAATCGAHLLQSGDGGEAIWLGSHHLSGETLDINEHESLLCSDPRGNYPGCEHCGLRTTEKLAWYQKSVKVYDIQNAGRYHRYTVSGKLVHNCGYGGGPGALIQMGALDQGLEEADLPGIVRRWREASPQIVRFWHDAENAAMRCVKTGRPVRIKQGGVLFRVAHGALFLELPSGRHLVYIHPAIGENRFGGESITYMGMEQQSHVWARQETYGGKLAENLTQAIARDCLTAAMLRLDEAGYRIVAHVHDEVIVEMPDGTGSLDEAIRIMTRNEGWNQGLVMDADGFETKYYKKD